MTPDRARAILATAEKSANAAGGDQDRLLELLVRAGDEVGDALDVLVATDEDAALRLAASLGAYWQDSGRVDEGRQKTEALLQQAAPVPLAARAGAFVVASELAFRQGDQDATRRHAASAIEGGRLAGDPGVIGRAHLNLARAAYREGDAAGIGREAQQALSAAPEDVAVRRGALHMLAWSAYEAGDRATARKFFEESLSLRLEMGDRLGAASEEANLADLAAEEGDLPGAAAGLAGALRVAEELGSRYLVVNLLPSLAAIAARSGRDDDCARLLGATDAMSQASGLIPDPGNWQEVTDQAQARLGQRFETLRTEGRHLSPQAAVELALGVASHAAAGE
jgi:tetratricopeptide (TPR) repeat protein